MQERAGIKKMRHPYGEGAYKVTVALSEQTLGRLKAWAKDHHVSVSKAADDLISMGLDAWLENWQEWRKQHE